MLPEHLSYNEELDGIVRVVGQSGDIVERFERVGTEWLYKTQRFISLDHAKAAYEQFLEMQAECFKEEMDILKRSMLWRMPPHSCGKVEDHPKLRWWQW